MARDRYRIIPTYQYHFVTSTIVNWIPILAYPKYRDIVRTSLEFLVNEHRIEIAAYVFMENHIHLVVSSPTLHKNLASFKSFTAKQMLQVLKRNKHESLLQQFEFYKLSHRYDRQYQIWQEGNHPIAIRNETVLRQKIDYIHNNPVRREYVDDPAAWRFSSAIDYLGGTGVLPISIPWE